MRFARPELLWLLFLVPVLAMWQAWSLVRRRRALARFAAEPLMARLVHAGSLEKLVVKSALLAVAALLLILASARPQWGATLEQVRRQGVDVLIAMDISESMLAEDIKPSRLSKAREEASRLLDRLQGDRAGLVAFAGSAGVLCPLTLDYNAVRIFLDTLTPDMISYPGTSLGSAIRAGMRTFGSEQKKFKVMVLFSDGEDEVDREDVEKAAHEASAQGLIIHTVGVGTAMGDVIPMRGRDGQVDGYKKDSEGRVVTTRLEESMLAHVSELTGGSYFPATAAESELDRIAETIGQMDKRDVSARLTTQYEDRYQIPLGFGLATLIAEALLSPRRRVRGQTAPGDERSPARGTVRVAGLAMVFGIIASFAAPAQAASPSALVEEGNRLYKEGKLGEALGKYRQAQAVAPASAGIHYNIGNVLYRQGQFDKAYDEYRQAFPAQEKDLAQGARFNAGNSHFARRNWQDAIANYREALRMNPGDLEAKKNLELALRNMKQEQQKKQQQPKQQNQDKQDEKQKQRQKQEQEKNQPKDSGKPERQQNPSKSPQQEKEQISKDEAMRILDAMRDQDKPPTDRLKVPPPDRKPEKDW